MIAGTPETASWKTGKQGLLRLMFGKVFGTGEEAGFVKFDKIG
jgi:hypothetical protein